MAEKRITTVDEIVNIDPDADYLMVSRGVQQDLRRILARRLPNTFDLHDNVADELTTLAGIDRLLVSDEGSPGAPQRYIKLSTLRAFLLDLFDLHDDVPTELTTAVSADRLLISDESEPGDPQKFISFSNLKKSLGVMGSQEINTNFVFGNTYDNVAHSLGSKPIGGFTKFICTTAEKQYAIGDEIIVPLGLQVNTAGSWHYLMVDQMTDTTVRFRLNRLGSSGVFPNKNADSFSTLNASRWHVRLILIG